ncbi:MAG: DMT family transporter [Pseudomonadota bacterium]
MSYMPVPGSVRTRAASGNALAVGSMLLWAAGFPAAEVLLGSYDPLTLITMRLAMAMLVLLPIWALVDGTRAMRNARWRRGLWVGAFGFGIGTYAILLAQWFTDPVTVALFASVTPVAATAIEVLAGQRKVSWRFAVGVIASVIGGAVAVEGALGADIGWGVALVLVSGTLFSWASNASVRDFPDLSPLGRSTITFAGATVFAMLALGSGVLLGFDLVPARAITPNELGLLAIYAVAAMALSQILFIASVGRLGIALTAFHINIAPFYVMVFMLALGGEWSWPKVLGAAIVGAGVLISQRG